MRSAKKHSGPSFSWTLLSMILGLSFSSYEAKSLGLGLGPVASFSRNMLPVSGWDNWTSSWGGGFALQADLPLLSFEIDALWMQRKYRYSFTAGYVTSDQTILLNQIEIPIVVYFRADPGWGSLRLGGGVSNNFGQGRIYSKTTISSGDTVVLSGESLGSYSQWGLDPRSMDGIADLGWDLTFLGKGLKMDLRYQFAVDDRNTIVGGTEFKPKSINFIFGLLL